jgi:CrcB protein
MSLLWIGLGSAVGGMARHGVGGWIAQRAGEGFPWGTLAVNASGSLLIGLVFVLSGAEGRLRMDPLWRDFLMLGLLGGYTTFSSFSLQTLNLAREGQWGWAAGYVGLSLAACLGAVWVGFWGGQVLLATTGR